MPGKNNTVENVEGDVISPLAKYLFTDKELDEYIEEFKNFENKEQRQIPDVFSWEVMGDQDGGKTHTICTSYLLDPRNPIFKSGSPQYDAEYDHVKFLLDKKYIKPAGPVVGLDLDGKFYKMMTPDKFFGKPIKYKDLWHPAAEKPTMQDPVATVEEIVKFLKAANRMECGTAFIENMQRLTNIIQTYIQYWLRDRPEHKDLPLGHLPKYGYEDWGIRNSIWDFLGGFWQRMKIHFIVTTPMEPVWAENKGPTGDLEPKRYKQIPFYVGGIIKCWQTTDASRGSEFWGQITSSDFTDEGFKFPVIKSPSMLKYISEMAKVSHSYELKQAGFTFEDGKTKRKVVENGQEAKPKGSKANTKAKAE